MLPDDLTKFVQRYETNFGKTPPGSPDIWREWLETVPVIRHSDLIDYVARNRKGRFRPGMEDFKRAWLTIGEDAQSFRARTGCLHCYGGQLAVMGYFDDMKRLVLCDILVAGHEPWRFGKTAIHALYVPCSCEAGKKLTPNIRQPECIDWVVWKKTEWGFQQTGNCYDNSRDWQTMLDAKLDELTRECLALQAVEVRDRMTKTEAAEPVKYFVDVEKGGLAVGLEEPAEDLHDELPDGFIDENGEPKF